MEKSPQTLEIEQRIIVLLKRNEQSVIKLIYQHYGRNMFNAILRVLKDESLAQDVFQEVIIKIWRKGHYYEAKKGSLYTWLLSVCKNAAIDKTRSKAYKHGLHTQSSEQLATPAPAQASSLGEHAQLKELVTNLPQPQKQLIDMAFFQGYTHEEIAEQMDMPLGTVKTKIRSALKQLRKILK